MDKYKKICDKNISIIRVYKVFKKIQYTNNNELQV